MANPAFIVEGKHEKTLVQRLCGNRCPIEILATNGEDVSSEKIALIIDFILDSLSIRNYPIIIVMDREKRQIPAEELKEEVRSHLSNMGHDTEQFKFGIPDRKVEAWILPFVDEKGNMTQEPTFGFEGKDCLGELERRLGKQDEIYEKTTTGIKLFCNIDPTKLAEASNSFNLFFKQANKVCEWFSNR